MQPDLATELRQQWRGGAAARALAAFLAVQEAGEGCTDQTLSISCAELHCSGPARCLCEGWQEWRFPGQVFGLAGVEIAAQWRSQQQHI